MNERVIWEVALSGDNDTSEFFETTDDHPWWIVDADGNGSWKKTAELHAGMIVTTADNQTMTISSVIETSRTDATYNLTVADFETYFVGRNRVLVHNCNKKKKGGSEHKANARKSVEGKHQKGQSRQQRDQARSDAPKRGATRTERQQARKERKKSDDYLKKD